MISSLIAFSLHVKHKGEHLEKREVEIIVEPQRQKFQNGKTQHTYFPIKVNLEKRVFV